METTMLRKFALGLVAAGTLGIAALSPTSASAYERGPHFGRHQDSAVHRGWYGARAHFRHHHGCLQQRLVQTPWGPRYRTINVCR
jgi:hypothetical protein